MAKHSHNDQRTEAAKTFFNLLTSEQKSKAQFAWNSPEHEFFMYVPGPRKGVSWGELNEAQQAAGVTLLKSFLSKIGYSKIEAIRNRETILAELENGNKERDPSRYWFTFYGSPNSETAWGWKYEGHHLSLSFTTKSGLLVSSTPQFMGSNPAEVKSGKLKGNRILDKQQDLAFALIESLTPDQKKQAIISEVAPVDIVTGTARIAVIKEHLGIHYLSLNILQQRALIDLIKCHATVQTATEQKRRIDSIKTEGLDKLVFAWYGPTTRANRHYYRIQNNTFLIEYDNTQEDGNHIHTVWRNLKEDFGQDALADHYEHDHHHNTNHD